MKAVYIKLIILGVIGFWCISIPQVANAQEGSCVNGYGDFYVERNGDGTYSCNFTGEGGDFVYVDCIITEVGYESLGVCESITLIDPDGNATNLSAGNATLSADGLYRLNIEHDFTQWVTTPIENCREVNVSCGEDGNCIREEICDGGERELLRMQGNVLVGLQNGSSTTNETSNDSSVSTPITSSSAFDGTITEVDGFQIRVPSSLSSQVETVEDRDNSAAGALPLLALVGSFAGVGFILGVFARKGFGLTFLLVIIGGGIGFGAAQQAAALELVEDQFFSDKIRFVERLAIKETDISNSNGELIVIPVQGSLTDVTFYTLEVDGDGVEQITEEIFTQISDNALGGMQLSALVMISSPRFSADGNIGIYIGSIVEYPTVSSAIGNNVIMNFHSIDLKTGDINTSMTQDEIDELLPDTSQAIRGDIVATADAKLTITQGGNSAQVIDFFTNPTLYGWSESGELLVISEGVGYTLNIEEQIITQITNEELNIGSAAWYSPS